MMDNKHNEILPELLAPAGGPAELRAAVENGADAVYLGGQGFNARASAANFDGPALREGIAYAHERGVRVHVAMNTLIADGEMARAIDGAGAAWLAGADALIVQDLGFAALLRQRLPGLPLHLSTQGTVTGVPTIAALREWGFARFILARELTLDEIAETAALSPVPVEVFVHGALCVCYSGQCLMSSMIGARSGNRGRCAQPCRLPWRLGDGEPAYLLSPKDLCGLDDLPALVRAGVASLKIEGRMKGLEYVAVVTATYRKYLDRIAAGEPWAVEPEDRRRLAQVFNRGGFSKGYLTGWSGAGFISRESPKHAGVPIGRVERVLARERQIEVTLTAPLALGDGVEVVNPARPGGIVTWLWQDGAATRAAHPGRARVGDLTGTMAPGDRLCKITDRALEDEARATVEGKPRRLIPIHGRFCTAVGQPLQLALWDDEGHRAEAESAAPAEEARSRPLEADAVRAQLAKTGDTPYRLEDCDVTLDGRAAAPLSALNALRRDALAGLAAQRANRTPERVFVPEALPPAGERALPVEPKVAAFLWQWRAGLADVVAGADRLVVPLLPWLRGEISLPRRPAEVFGWLPMVTGPRWVQALGRALPDLPAAGLDGLLVGSAGHLVMLEGCGLPLWGDLSFQVFNGWTLERMASLGLAGVTLSPEMTLAQVAGLPAASLAREAVVYGRLPLMVSAHCPVGAEHGSHGEPCGACATGRPFTLTDRRDKAFPVLCDPTDCHSTILNGDKLAAFGLLPRLARAGMDWLRLMIHDEEPDEVAALIAATRQALAGSPPEGWQGPGYTKGHYQRGVLE